MIKYISIKLTSLLLMLLFCLSTKAQSQVIDVKIYSVRDTSELWDKKYKSEIYWGFCKIDWAEKTIEFKEFSFRDGDNTPDLSSITNIFDDGDKYKNENKDWFKIISPTKIKVPRVKGTRTKRSWNDFATGGSNGGEPAQMYFINADTIWKKGAQRKFILDKNLTKQYLQEQQKQ